MQHYQIVLAIYGDRYRILTCSSTSRTSSWYHRDIIEQSSELRSVVSSSSSAPHLVDVSVMTDPVSDVISPYDHPAPAIFRRIERPEPLFPTFAELPDPSILMPQIKPTCIYSIDLKNKTAVVSLSGSSERVLRNLSDLIILNPQLLANYLVMNGK
jgi:hypothetical protein